MNPARPSGSAMRDALCESGTPARSRAPSITDRTVAFVGNSEFWATLASRTPRRIATSPVSGATRPRAADAAVVLLGANVAVADHSIACGEQLLLDDRVRVQFWERPAGAGITPVGLYVQHSTGLPAIFGTILACSVGATAAGYAPGHTVVFLRYAGEITDILEDGTIFATFDYHDIITRVLL